MEIKTLEINEVSQEYKNLSLAPQEFQNYLLFQAGYRHQKRIWVLGYLKQNPQDSLLKPYGGEKSLSLSFSLASFFLCRCFQSILEQAKAYFGTLQRRI